MECTEVQNPPSPVVTRWTSWYTAVLYHHTHLKFYRSFFEQESETHGSATIKAIISLLESPELEEQLQFVAENSGRLQHVLMSFAASTVCVHEVYDRVHDLMA
jgi:hypothetical protein